MVRPMKIFGLYDCMTNKLVCEGNADELAYATGVHRVTIHKLADTQQRVGRGFYVKYHRDEEPKGNRFNCYQDGKLIYENMSAVDLGEELGYETSYIYYLAKKGITTPYGMVIKKYEERESDEIAKD